MSLFAEPPPTVHRPGDIPLAERMRPTRLEDFVGQRAVLADGELLHSVLHQGELCSLVLWGPPGSGKTTLARLLAARTDSAFVPFSAVLAGIKEVREVMAEARRSKHRAGRRTILFIDEIHRFNRAQQDAFLPYVEAGDLILIGATTENPSFSLNAALLSRLKVVVLSALGEAELVRILERAAQTLSLRCEPASLAAIARHAGGDARRALTTLEVAARLAAEPSSLDLDTARRALQHKTLLYDRAGEEHYNLISALHKSIRNSDVQAALYWLLRLIESGEDPRYAARRMLVIASEDIGLADPMALSVALGAMQAYEALGLPEGRLALAEAAIYLASAPKSNAVYRAVNAVVEDLHEETAAAVPLHLRNAVTGLMDSIGYGRGYVYAHDEPESVADMPCLPEALVHRRWFEPGSAGFERKVRERMQQIEAARERAARRGNEDQDADRDLPAQSDGR